MHAAAGALQHIACWSGARARPGQAGESTGHPPCQPNGCLPGPFALRPGTPTSLCCASGLQVAEVTAHNEYQLKLKDLALNEKLRQLTDKAASEAAEAAQRCARRGGGGSGNGRGRQAGAGLLLWGLGSLRTHLSHSSILTPHTHPHPHPPPSRLATATSYPSPPHTLPVAHPEIPAGTTRCWRTELSWKPGTRRACGTARRQPPRSWWPWTPSSSRSWCMRWSGCRRRGRPRTRSTPSEEGQRCSQAAACV